MNQLKLSVQGSVCLVTGANRGIGKSILETFLAHNAAKVYAAVRNLDTATPLVERFGDRVVPLLLDLALPETILEAKNLASDVNILVSNAGVLSMTRALDKNAITNLMHEMEINVVGPIRLAQAFAPTLRANGGGAFVQLNSVASLKSFAEAATYSASKAAAYSLTQALREDLRSNGTLVASIHPGPIATDMATEAGLDGVAESPLIVAETVVDCIETGCFHGFPDSMALKFAAAYQSFAESVIEKDLGEN